MSTGQRQRVKLAQAIAADPQPDRARRADRRARPGAARRDAEHHRAGQPQLRDRRDAVVARPRRGRTDLRPRRGARRRSARRAGLDDRTRRRARRRRGRVDRPRSTGRARSTRSNAGSSTAGCTRATPRTSRSRCRARPTTSCSTPSSRAVAAGAGAGRRRSAGGDARSTTCSRATSSTPDRRSRIVNQPPPPGPAVAPGDPAHRSSIVDSSGTTGRVRASRQAIRSVTWQSIRATLGLGRPARHKIFPVIAVVIAYIPAIVFVGLVGDRRRHPRPERDRRLSRATTASSPRRSCCSPGSSPPRCSSATAATACSRCTCRRRCTGAPISSPRRSRSLLTLGLVTLGPPLLLLIGYTFENAGPDGLGRLADGAASDRRVGVRDLRCAQLRSRWRRRASPTVAPSRRSGSCCSRSPRPTVASALVEGAELSPNWRLIDVFSMPFELVFRIFGEPGNFPELSTVSVVAVNLAWTIGGHRRRRLALLPTGDRPMSDDTPVRDRTARPHSPAAELAPACSRRHHRPGPSRRRHRRRSAPGRSVRRAASPHRDDRGQQRVEVLRLGGGRQRRELRDRPGRHRAARPERRRQVDAVPHAVRAHARRRAAPCACSVRTRAATVTSAGRSASSRSRTRCSTTSTRAASSSSVAARTQGIDAADIRRVAHWALEQVELHDVGIEAGRPVLQGHAAAGQGGGGPRQRSRRCSCSTSRSPGSTRCSAAG